MNRKPWSESVLDLAVASAVASVAAAALTFVVALVREELDYRRVKS